MSSIVQKVFVCSRRCTSTASPSNSRLSRRLQPTRSSPWTHLTEMEIWSRFTGSKFGAKIDRSCSDVNGRDRDVVVKGKLIGKGATVRNTTLIANPLTFMSDSTVSQAHYPEG
jgi:hypothetical protein